ncbi:hypothetical protein D2T31_09345 [Sinirhodobacter populi]|uniref:Uncharacterized protein n=1 Tax=Paenirhodobacter populi TaxID=2306993 RepID=A0A443KB71_9RHOB|nr:hypothetical protein [Sinirhodobacter populi]RWR30081.1 hypothetical protein D2T31_09345 [Sinirhodobacter populi]
MAGSYGTPERLYMCGPFRNGMPGQSDLLPRVMRDCCRVGFASLSQYCLTICQGDSPIPAGICRSPLKGGRPLSLIPSKVLFTHILDNTMEGVVTELLSGGNRNRVFCRKTGFPVARHDYRPCATRYNENLDLDPLSIAGRAA